MNQKRECVREKIYSVIIIKMLVMKTIYKRIAKRTLLLILIVHLSMLSFAATYYVSNTGSDSNDGTSISTAWQTLTKVNSKTFVPGDQILFQRGNTFYGSITIKNSGIAGNPITFGAYGTGTNPIITGFTSVTAWTNLGSNIWESTSAVSTLPNCKMVTINDVNTPMGRYPNSQWLTFESHLGSTSLTSSSLTGAQNWTGADICYYVGTFISNIVTISNQSGSTLTHTSIAPYEGTNNSSRFFIENDARTLDVQNEWYYNPTTHKIRIYSISQPINVKVASVEKTIIVNANYLKFENITFTGTNGATFYNWDQSPRWNNLTVSNCQFQNIGASAVNTLTNYLTVENCTISNSNGGAISSSYGTNITIRNNTIDFIGEYIGMRSSYFGSNSAIDAATVDGLNVESNTIKKVGYNAISFYGVNVLVKNNFIDTYCNVLDDGGGIYTFTGARTPMTNIKIDGNIVINGIGAGASNIASGIYLDERSKNVEVSNNSIGNASLYGIFLNTSAGNINVHHNIVYNASSYQYYSTYWGTETPLLPPTGNQVNNNIFVARTKDTQWNDANQKCISFYFTRANATPANDLMLASTTLDNNYYARPISQTEVVRFNHELWNTGFQTLEQWQKFSIKDVNSHKSPQTITSSDDLQFEYNPTTTAKSVTLSRPMMDMKGNRYTGSITLQPFTSIVLMKDLTPVVVPGAPTSPVATAGNASASVTFVAPTNNGGSAITGYTVTSIPAGGVDANAGSTSLTHTITGLTNGTSYTFTVKATNSVGTSVASLASNSVIPKAPVATSFQFTGPSSGNVNSASTSFTITPNNPYTGTITITPSGTGSAGLSAIVLTFSGSSTAKTFTITPTVAGNITLTPSNNSSLTNPANLTYTTNAVAPGVPTLPVATAVDASASVTFVAPTNNGGSAITGYTVTSNPAGGVDANSGSSSLIHTVTGLTNGTTYTFIVKATNAVGVSVASAASNPVTPVAVVIKQGDITPSHFTTVWQGANGLNHMNIIVASATLEDIPLSLNDEIAVYSGTACVGAAKLTQSIVSTDNTSFLTILASQNDGSNNGFSENDTILFKVWDNRNKVEKQINGVVYRNDVATWKTTGRYVSGSTAMVEISSYKVYTQSIELLKGYNMISTYVSALNPSANVVAKPLIDQGNLIKMQDETGNSFENWGDFGGWVNQLGSLEKTEGYKIQVANNCTLQVTGRAIAMPLSISLKTGWNIISYPRTDIVNAMNVVQALIDQNKLVKVQDEAGNSIENWGLFGGWKNGIGSFIPGKAYKVKMNADAILTFQESYPKSAVVIAKSEETKYYHSSIEGNGTDHMNINLTGLNSIGISIGDELAAFDGGICVATAKITEANLNSGTACLVSSFSTNDQNPNGFKVGDPIQISLWSQLSGTESKVDTEVLTGQMKYEKNSSVFVKTKSATIATSVSDLADFVKIDVFPNPCQGKFSVRFSEIPEANSRVEISDISGRKLISRFVSSTLEEFNLESLTPGLYLVKSILGTKEQVHKLIVNK